MPSVMPQIKENEIGKKLDIVGMDFDVIDLQN
jgi:hypothetical protein